MPRAHSFLQRLFAALLLAAFALSMALAAEVARAATLCVAPGGAGGCYATITAAIDAATDGDTITVAKGTYNENITIDKSLTLQSEDGAAATTLTAANSAAPTITIAADGVTIDGFTIKNHGGTFAIYAENHSNLTIRNNIVTDVRANDADGKYVHALAIVTTTTPAENITVENNVFSNIASATKSASAMNFGWTTYATLVNRNITVRGNTITNITAGGGAYGILLSHSTTNAKIFSNTITNLHGGWARGIGVEGNQNRTAAIQVILEKNAISNISSDYANAASALNFETLDTAHSTAYIKRNRFENLPVGITNQTDQPLDAQYNYWANVTTHTLVAPNAGAIDDTTPCYQAGCFPEVHTTTPPTGAVLAAGPTQVVVTYTEEVTQASAENTANYLLAEAGANHTFDTTSCVAGLAGDDVPFAVTAASYNSADFTATLQVNHGTPLPAGHYRLLVCGTTSIANRFYSYIQGHNVELNDGAADTVVDFTVQTAPTTLPKTGFPQGRKTVLAAQPQAKTYAATGLTLHIPTLGLTMPIVGVPRSGNSWDVSWLGNRAGYLEGSAFPTWDGNTVLTGHVWNADNTPGPFLHLKDLRYGDHIEIHAWGLVYTYEVRSNLFLLPGQVNRAFRHENRDWVTLLTCEGYNPITENYTFRRAVRAVLVRVDFDR